MQLRTWWSIILGGLWLSGLGCWVGFQRATGTFERTWTVTPGVHLTVENRAGAIRVQAGEPGRVWIRGRVVVRGVSFEQVRQEIQAVLDTPPVEKMGNAIRVKRWRAQQWRWFATPLARVTIHYDIEVPPDATVNVRTGAGDVEIAAVRGPVEIHTGAGDVDVTDIEKNIRIWTGAGDVEIREAQSSVEIHTGTGDVELVSIGGAVTVNTGVGDIVAKRLRGDLDADTGVGDVSIVQENQVPRAQWRIHSGTGDIRLRIPTSGGFSVEALTGIGRITVDFPWAEVRIQRRRRVEGTVGQPVLELKLHTGVGDIEIHQSPHTQRVAPEEAFLNTKLPK